MKKIITLLAFILLVSVNSYAQTSEKKYEFAVVYSRLRISIDFGNNREEKFIDIIHAKSSNDFSIVDALNYMSGQGYELVSTISPHDGPDEYIFRREIKR